MMFWYRFGVHKRNPIPIFGIGVRNLSSNSKRSKRFSDTLNIPSTKFPLSIKDGAAAKRELEIQKTSGFANLYNWQKSQNQDKTFILHDGPPYANGKPHVGHAINKILKDITNRFQVLQGYRVCYTPGWDCHGLPIELKAVSENKARELSPGQIRHRARNFAEQAIKKQKDAFKRWGVMANWEKDCYFTFDPKYEANQLDLFYQMFQKELIHQDFMPVYWSTSSKTALAEAELEYNPEHVSTAVYVKFPIVSLPQGLHNLFHGSNRKVYAVIWTTTPWTLPANEAICYGPGLRYSIIEDDKGNIYICEKEFVEKFSSLVGNTTVKTEVDGKALEGTMYQHPLKPQGQSPFLPGNHVTSQVGSGLVHTAPAHGQDDFNMALQYKLPVGCVVDEDGKYTQDAGENLHNKVVGRDADSTVIELLGDHVLNVEEFKHSYPYDWRTKKPVIIRASKQWFVDTEKLYDLAMESIQKVGIIPATYGKSMISQLQSRKYWCISRQRVWGVPIPVFYHKETNEPLINSSTMDHLRKLILQHGSDCWWNMTESELLPQDKLREMNLGSPEDFRKGQDILDIWFDSGASWASVLPENQQADIYLEGLDQFKGWFQTSLLTSVATTGKSPYKQLLVHGFAVDEMGHKMSKSIGNVVDPEDIVGGKNKYGADVLRIWAAHSTFQSKVMVGPAVIEKCKEEIFEIRKMLRHLLGNLFYFTEETLQLTYDDLLPQDKYMLNLLQNYVNEVTKLYKEYYYSKVLQVTGVFINLDVSKFYVSITKDRLYCSDRDGPERKSAQFVLYKLLDAITKSVAPIVPHLAEEVYQYYPIKNEECLFHAGWFDGEETWNNPDIQRIMEPMMDIRKEMFSILGAESPSDFDVTIYTRSSHLFQLLQVMQEEDVSCHSPLCEVLQTAYTAITTKPPKIIPEDVQSTNSVCNVHSEDGSTSQHDYTLLISAALNHRCERCRRYISKSASSPCDRCLHVISSDWR